MMRAAVLFETGKPLEICENIEIPPLRRGQVHVRLEMSGVCHSQLQEVSGGRGEDRFLPHLLGHEGVGRVVAIGEGVSKVRVGQKVVLGWIKGQGIEAGGVKYTWKGSGDRAPLSLNGGGVTTFNTDAVVSENRLVVIDDQIPSEIATLFGCAVPTGAGMVLNQLPEGPGSIAVFGMGGIGLCALMAAKTRGFGTRIAVDIVDGKLALARELGATHVVNAKSQDPVTFLRDLSGGAGVDYTLDCAGQVRTIEQAFESIRRGGGKCVFASHPSAGQKVSIDPFELICGKKLEGSWGGSSAPDRDVPIFSKHYQSGDWPLGKLFSQTYTLDQVNVALDDLKHGRVARPLLKFQS